MSEQLVYRGEMRNSVEPKPLDELKLELEGARSHWAKISAKRQNRLFDRRIHGYNEARQNYNALVAEYGRRSLAERIGAAESARERNVLALNYIVDMQNQLRAETDKISDSKRMRKFGRAIGKWFTTGSKVTQFAKGAAVSLVAGAAGGLVGASVATLAAMRFAKGYLTSEVSGLGKVDASAYHDEFAQDEDHETLLQRAQAKSAEVFESAGEDQQNKKRDAVKRGVGRMAVGLVVGGTIGALIHSAMDLPVAHATPLSGNTYGSPELVSSGYDSPGISAGTTEYSGPGMSGVGYESTGLSVSQPVVEATSPGLSGMETVYASPGLEAATNVHPGLVLADDPTAYASPGLMESGDYASPGLVDYQEAAASAYASPGLAEYDVASPVLVGGAHDAPGLATSDTYSSPGLLEVTDSGNPDLSLDESGYQSPGLTVVDTGSGDHAPDSSELFELDNVFTVQHGNGYVREIMDTARANDIDLTSEQAWEIHEDIVDKVGTDYINLLHHEGPDTYSMGDSKYETGISAPGKAEWDTQAADILQDKFTELSVHGNGEFSVSHISNGHDVDAQSYYDALKGVDKSHWETILNEAAPHLRSVTYDGESLTYHDASGWHFREVDRLPAEARDALKVAATKHNWTLAS